MTPISKETIRTQLVRILDNPDFSNGKRPGQFLRYVVEQTLNGQSRVIKQYTIAVEGLGYKDDFNPQTNPAIRILARRLRRILDNYYRSQGVGDPIRIEIPKGTYIPSFRENTVGAGVQGGAECTTPRFGSNSRFQSRPTIAVMMFDCLNDKEEINYVATGLTEEIIIVLTQFPEFFVVGPLDRDVIREKKLDAHGIGQRHGVRFLLDASLRKHEDLFRLTVRLTDTIVGQHLWGRALDFSLQNGSMMTVQNDLVGQIAAVIADSYGIIPLTLKKESFIRREGEPDAYEAVLHYYHYFRVLTQESYINAMNALEKSVQNNPQNALVTAALGDLLASTYLFGNSDDKTILIRAELLARIAMALDPNCQVVRFTIALIHFINCQRSMFLHEAEQALHLNPNNAHFVAVLALHMAMVGEWDRAMKLIRKAMRLNPHHPGWCHIIAFMNCYRQGEYDLAWIEAQRFNTPDFFWDPLIRAAVLGKLGRRAEAQKAVADLLKLEPDFKRRGPDLIRRLTFLDEHVDMLLDGLHQAGLETRRSMSN